VTIVNNSPNPAARTAAGRGQSLAGAAQQRPAAGSGPQDPAGPQVDVDKLDKVEDRVKLIILTAIMAASLAASFSHMHDWTMRWMPAGTDDWFGWANATISELVPLVATLSLRKRLHQGKSLWSYALVILVAGAVLSLAAQLSAVGSDSSTSAKFLACLPSIAFLLLSKLVIGDLDAGRKHTDTEADRQRQAAEERKRSAQQLREARAETAAARTELAEIRAHAQAETGRAETEIAARREAETRAETQAEIARAAQAEIARHDQAAGKAVQGRQAAERAAAEQGQAAHLAEGRLAEAREAADRAAAARVLAEQTAAAEVQQVRAGAERAERELRQDLAAATGAGAHAERRAAELAEQLRQMQVQGEQLQDLVDRSTTARVRVEQQITELQQVHNGALNEIERLRRALARASEKPEIGAGRRPEISGARQPEITRGAKRKSLALVPVSLPEGLPDVETVRPETVALVLAARARFPDATQSELHEHTDISARTIRKVLTAVPAEIVGQLFDLGDGHVA
jgi:hypothetical protein